MKRIFFILIPALIFAISAAASGIIGYSEINLRASDTERLGSTELELGSLAADALRARTGADIAIVCSGELGVNLPAGDITNESIADCFPLNRDVYTAVITTAQLHSLLEALLSHIVISDTERIDWAASQFDGFPQISGFSMEYDASIPAGSRIKGLVLDSGAELSGGEDTHVIAASGYLLTGGYGGEKQQSVEASMSYAGTQREIIGAYISQIGTITHPPSEGRIKVIGARQDMLIDRIPLGIIILAVILFIIGRSMRFKKAFDPER